MDGETLGLYSKGVGSSCSKERNKEVIRKPIVGEAWGNPYLKKKTWVQFEECTLGCPGVDRFGMKHNATRIDKKFHLSDNRPELKNARGRGGTPPYSVEGIDKYTARKSLRQGAAL